MQNLYSISMNIIHYKPFPILDQSINTRKKNLESHIANRKKQQQQSNKYSDSDLQMHEL